MSAIWFVTVACLRMEDLRALRMESSSGLRGRPDTKSYHVPVCLSLFSSLLIRMSQKWGLLILVAGFPRGEAPPKCPGNLACFLEQHSSWKQKEDQVSLGLTQGEAVLPWVCAALPQIHNSEHLDWNSLFQSSPECSGQHRKILPLVMGNGNVSHK